MHVDDRLGVLEHMEQDRRGNVVGQVADQPDPALAGQLAEIDLEHVLVHDGQFADAVRGLGERRDEIAVELDDGQRAVLPEQRKGDRALARSDFNQVVARLRVDREHDFLDDVAIMQEVLAQLFLRRFLEMAHARLRACASCAHSATAAIRLEGSALPVPAISSAVP